MRIGIALILLTDLFIRSLSIKAFFTDEGILPLSILKSSNWNPYYFSFHAMHGDLWWQVLLFSINALCIILLLVGYRARLFTFICWTFLVSIQNRNPFILQGGDELLRIILFWGVFLPWGERYSVQKTSAYPNAYFSLANVGYLFLIASVYIFSALLKTSAEWHSDGTALYYALSLDQMRLPFGTFLYQFPNLLTHLTRAVYYIELLAPFLLILPFVPSKVRVIGIFSIALLHIGFFLSLYVGLFYIIGIVSLIGLLPGNCINWFERTFYKNNVTLIEIDANQQKASIISDILFTLKTWLIVFIISYCLMLNLGNVKAFPYVMESYLAKYGTMLRLEQNWGMFAPTILKDDGWFVYSGYTTDGKFIDIKHNTDSVSYVKPKHIVTEYESDRWRKYGENYVFNNNNHIRPFYCKYLINKWNTEHPDKHIIDLSIFYMKEYSLPNYGTKPIEKLALCNCQDK